MAKFEYNKKMYPLIEKLVIGRQKSCDVALLDQGASREHCKIFHDNKNRIWVEDLGSANGTKVNSEKIHAPLKLKDGDIIVCSKSQIIVHFDEEDKEQNRTKQDIFNPEALVNKLIAGHRIQSVIGSTNIVTVYIAHQLSLDRNVVLKVVHPSFADAESPLAKEIDEQTKLAARINHQSIAQVHECGTEQNFIWSTMELIDGEMMFDLLDREGQLPPEIALMMAEKIADGLHSAHEQGLVHRALNPRNIMLSKDGRVKVVDLVLEQFLRYHLEQKGIPTPEDHADYLAPELLKGKRGDAKSDIYGLGCILFQMLSGQPPYVFDSASKTAQAHLNDAIPKITDYCPDLPSNIQECVSTMLHKNAEWRHQSMGDVRDELAKIRQDLPKTIGQQKARKVDRPSPSERLNSQKRSTGFGIFLNIIIIAVIAVIAWFLINGLNKDAFTQGFTPREHAPTSNDDVNNITPDTDLSGMSAQAQANQAKRDAEQKNRALEDLWQRNKTKIEQAINDNEWDSAEYTLKRCLPQFKSSRRITATANNLLKQILIDGDTWYNQELQKINSGTSIQDLRQQCIDLNNLRSKVLKDTRPDVEARHQQALTAMRRHLSRAKQAAISHVEQGDLKTLKQQVDALKADFAGTRIEQDHAAFAALVNEAQKMQHLGDWASTRQQLLNASGNENILTASAALILSGNGEDGTRLLLSNSEQFNSPSLRKRHDALLASQAKVISFDDSSDLKHLKLITGQPVSANGFIHGTADELYEIETKLNLNNKQWEVRCNMQFPKGLGANSEFIVQLGNNNSTPVTISFDQRQAITRIETTDAEKETPTSYKNRQAQELRLRYINNTIYVLLNNNLLSEASIGIPNRANISFSSTGCNWQLQQIQVVMNE